MNNKHSKLKLPPLEVLGERLIYDFSTGIFKWAKDMLNNKIKEGSIAGCRKRSNDAFYLYIGIDGVQYAAHRLAYYIYHELDPYPLDVHHKNFNTFDNSIVNLELLSSCENNKYKNLYKNNRSGITGVRITSGGRFRTTIYKQGKEFNLGTFNTKKEAIQAKKEFKVLT